MILPERNQTLFATMRNNVHRILKQTAADKVMVGGVTGKTALLRLTVYSFKPHLWLQ
jgi:hypothetical protein